MTPAQRQRLRTVLQASQQQREETRAQLDAAHGRLRALLAGHVPDEDAIMELADEIGRIRTSGHRAMLRLLLQVHADLSPAQRETLMQTAGREQPLEKRQRTEGMQPSWLRRLNSWSSRRVAASSRAREIVPG